MRKPDRTKNRSTPRSPYLVTPTMARSIQLVGTICPTKWNTSTIRTAKPRTPSSTGKCPIRRDGGLSLATAPDTAAVLGFDEAFTCAGPEIEPARRRPTRAQGPGAVPRSCAGEVAAETQRDAEVA